MTPRVSATPFPRKRGGNSVGAVKDPLTRKGFHSLAKAFGGMPLTTPPVEAVAERIKTLWKRTGVAETTPSTEAILPASSSPPPKRGEKFFMTMRW